MRYIAIVFPVDLLDDVHDVLHLVLPSEHLHEFIFADRLQRAKFLPLILAQAKVPVCVLSVVSRVSLGHI